MRSKQVHKEKENALEAIFDQTKAVIAVVHAHPLPGSPDYDGESPKEIYKAAVEDAVKYAEEGVDGIIVENHGDIPFLKPEDIGPETVAAMTMIASRVRGATKLPVGVNLLANAAKPAMAVAKSTESSFIRVNEWVNAYVANEGIVEGKAAEAMRYRSWIEARDIRVFTDVHVKHGAHAIVSDRSIKELTKDAEFFGSDAVIVTGHRTGNAPTEEEMSKIDEATQLPLIAGSGASIENIEEIFKVAEGVIIASSLKHEGVWWNPVDQKRVKDFMKKVKSLR